MNNENDARQQAVAQEKLKMAKPSSPDEATKLREQFSEQQKLLEAQNKQLEEMREKLSKQTAQAVVKQEGETAVVKNPVGEASPMTAASETVKTGGKEAKEASLKQSEDAEKLAKEAEEKVIAAYRNDEEANALRQAKVDAGVVPPFDNAPDEEKAAFRNKFQSDRQKRAEEHMKLQIEANKKIPTRVSAESKGRDVPANVDAPKPQPGSGGPANTNINVTGTSK